MAGSVKLATQAYSGAINEAAIAAKSIETAEPAPKATVHPIKAKSAGASTGKQSEFQGYGGTEEELRDAVSNVSEALNAVAKATDRNLSFTVNDETGDIVIQVTDAETGEEIRTIPTEHVLQMKKSISSMAGLLFDSES